MTGEAPLLSRFELAAAELRALGVVLTQLPGEYRVNYPKAGDGTARLAEDIEQALELGRAMAADAPAPAAPARGKRRRTPLRMTPTTMRRRQIKAHNYRLRAHALRKLRDDA